MGAKDIAKYDENCKLGFDLWQVKSGTIFDNVLITDDAEHAKKVGEELWAVTKEAEKEAKSAGDDVDEDDEDLDDEEPEDEEDSEEPADGRRRCGPRRAVSMYEVCECECEWRRAAGWTLGARLSRSSRSDSSERVTRVRLWATAQFSVMQPP